MKLNDLDKKHVAQKALKENFGLTFNTSKMNKSSTFAMLSQVRKLIKEAKSSPNFYSNQTRPTYMKLVFMEQALSNHWEALNSARPKIVLENEEVEKSQVILAAQDMVDTVQKMIEQVNDMLVKELPALVDSIENDIGPNESQQFNQQASAALQTLNQTLPQTKEQMKAALSGLTGGGMNVASFGAPDQPEAMPAPELAAPEEPEVAPEEPEEAESPEETEMQAGRAKR